MHGIPCFCVFLCPHCSLPVVVVHLLAYHDAAVLQGGAGGDNRRDGMDQDGVVWVKLVQPGVQDSRATRIRYAMGGRFIVTQTRPSTFTPPPRRPPPVGVPTPVVCPVCAQVGAWFWLCVCVCLSVCLLLVGVHF